MKATLIQTNLEGHPPETNLYRLDEPFNGFEFVAVNAFEPFEQASIVGVDDDTGYIAADTVEALWRQWEYCSHSDALAAVDYEVVTE